MTDVDVIVAGGGPVGLAAAINARLAGLSVAVVEPRDGAIDKACGEGLMPGALPVLARLGVDPVGMPLRGVSYRDGTHVADHRFIAGEGRGVRRLALQQALADRAEGLGIERVTGRVDSVDQDGRSVSAAGLTASWLLACDGLHSRIRHSLGLERAMPSSGRRFGMRQHFTVAPWNDLIEVHWTPSAELYVTPVSADTVGVAVLGLKGTDLAAAIHSVPYLAERLSGTVPASELRGAGPFRQRSTRRQAGRVLLVGDASGYVDAITGEGLRLGFEQARVAVESLAGGESYERAWNRATRDFRMLTSGLVRAASSPLRSLIVPAATRLPRIYGAVVERLAR
ncbi:MAG: NAD(P)/FAD-dependent oxidoreductase [Rhodoglobus sp.]